MVARPDRSGVRREDLARFRAFTRRFQLQLPVEAKAALREHGADWQRRMITTRFGGFLDGLKTRTGGMWRSLGFEVTGGSLNGMRLRVGSNHPGARAQEYGAHIFPRRAKFLAIPIGANLTPAGIRRYASPLELKGAPGVHLAKIGGSLFVVRDVGERFEFLFALQKKVTLPGPKTTGAPSRLNLVRTAAGPDARQRLRRRLLGAIYKTARFASRSSRFGVGPFGGGS